MSLSIQDLPIGASADRRLRLAYEAPRLTAYGPLNTLTTGGSGTSNEADCIPGNLTGCNPDPNKWRPG